MTEKHKAELRTKFGTLIKETGMDLYIEEYLIPDLEEWIDESFPVDKPVMRFAKPVINEFEFIKWMEDQHFYSTSEETSIDKYILQSYYDTVEQFINSPESKATKSVFEIATQTLKKYLEQNA